MTRMLDASFFVARKEVILAVPAPFPETKAAIAPDTIIIV
jgi:hypothetical protein